MRALLTAAVIATGLTALAGAQTAQTPAPAPDTRPPVAPETQACAPGTTGSAADGRTLSDQLAQSKGVICPPPTLDREMTAPPPEGGRTPVIPPPGSPGGDQSVQPK
jgi:hypothetical protein